MYTCIPYILIFRTSFHGDATFLAPGGDDQRLAGGLHGAAHVQQLWIDPDLREPLGWEDHHGDRGENGRPNECLGDAGFMSSVYLKKEKKPAFLCCSNSNSVSSCKKHDILQMFNVIDPVCKTAIVVNKLRRLCGGHHFGLLNSLNWWKRIAFPRRIQIHGRRYGRNMAVSWMKNVE